ncbi:MAG TPA: hypothetical protein DDX91_07545 [Ruminococcaceae bacterium]|nr:hypothetical protein [Oscillospiraceae bacterium]
MKKQKAVQMFSALFGFALFIILIIDSEGTIDAAKRSVEVCLTVIIPSLFAFMVFSGIFIKSGLGDILFFPLYKLNSFWFKGSRREFSIFVTSLFGGYPVGIKLLKEYIAYNKNYTAIAEKMLCYCYCGSPSFIIQIVGLSVLGNAAAGFMVYLSNIAACFTIAVIINIRLPKRSKYKEYAAATKIRIDDFTDSIADTVKALGIICGTILAFNIIIEMLDFCGVVKLLAPFNADKAFLSITEISNLSLFKGNNYALLPFFAAVTSFGGFCIIAQTAALAKGKISLKGFLLSRLPASVLSGLYMYLISLAIPISIEASSNITLSPSFSAVDTISTACLLIMTYILLKEAGNLRLPK